jgi:hypothetical protein
MDVVRHVSQQSEIIRKHNYLTEAKYRLTLQEARVLAWLIAQIHKRDKDVQIYEMSVLEFARLAGLKDKNPYTEVYKIFEELEI